MTQMSEKSVKPARSRRDARQEGRGLVGDRQGHRRGAADRARRAHASLPAVQHPLGLAGADAARRRLPVRVEIRLRLFAFLAAGLPRSRPAGDAGPHLRLAAEARRHHRLQAAERRPDRLHQAADRPAGRQDPGRPRPAHHQRRDGPARADRALSDGQPLRQARGGAAAISRRCRTASSTRSSRSTATKAPSTTPRSTTCRPAIIS